MADKSKQELLLEAIKIFLWPVVILVAIIWFGNDLKDMLNNRSFKIGLVEVGDRISTLEGSVQGGLISQKDYLDQILENADDSSKVRELTEKAIQAIENAQVGIKKEIQNISMAVPEFSETIPEQKSKASTKPLTATEWEDRGFEALLNRDINVVILALTEAEKIMPDLHNVSEIRRLMVKNKDQLTDPESGNWKIVYERVLKEYSWGMPTYYRQQMENYLQEN